MPNCSAEPGVLPSGTSWGGLEIIKKARKPWDSLTFGAILGSLCRAGTARPTRLQASPRLGAVGAPKSPKRQGNPCNSLRFVDFGGFPGFPLHSGFFPAQKKGFICAFKAPPKDQETQWKTVFHDIGETTPQNLIKPETRLLSQIPFGKEPYKPLKPNIFISNL